MLYIAELKATCHITRQASINAHASHAYNFPSSIGPAKCYGFNAQLLIEQVAVTFLLR